MSSLCDRWPLTMIGSGEEAFQLRESAVAEMSMWDWEKTSWPERRMHIAWSWGVRLVDMMAKVKQ